MKRSTLVSIMSVIGLGVFACDDAVGPAAFDAEPRVVFVSNRDGNDEIYSVNSDGTGLLRLTNHPARDGRPSWSPDGLHVAFTSERDGNREMYVMRADGTGLTNLSRYSCVDNNSSWSPYVLRR